MSPHLLTGECISAIQTDHQLIEQPATSYWMGRNHFKNYYSLYLDLCLFTMLEEVVFQYLPNLKLKSFPNMTHMILNASTSSLVLISPSKMPYFQIKAQVLMCFNAPFYIFLNHSNLDHYVLLTSIPISTKFEILVIFKHDTHDP